MVEKTTLQEDGSHYAPGKTLPKRTYRILFIEDNADDVELMQFELREADMSFISRVTDRKNELVGLIKTFRPHVVLADYSLTTFNGVQAFQLLREHDINTPFILVTGALSENMALACLKVGIDDFVLKSSFKRLPNAIISAIDKKDAEDGKRRMAAELRKSHEELQLLLDRQHIRIEEERKTIARDLHDELGQSLTALKIDITILERKIISHAISDKDATQEFLSITHLVDRITQSVKSISSGLRPDTIDNLGVIDAIRWQIDEFKKRNGMNCKAFLPTDLEDIGRNLSIAMFRIVQESLTNVARHAKATEVEVHLIATSDTLLMKIRDNGVGISEEHVNSSRSLGLIGLRERVRALKGVFTIRRGEKSGTSLTVTLPRKTESI